MKNPNPRPNTSAETDQPTAHLSAQKSAGSRTVLTVDSFIEAAQAPATKQGYANDVRDFMNRGGEIPATPDQVMNYLAQIAAELAVATIERRLIAIHKAHIDQGHVSPVSHPMVKRTMQGIRRTLGTRQRQARAIIKDDLLEMMVMVDKREPMRAARDKALLLVGFAGAFRRSELVGICIEDITEHSNGLEVLLRHSKTDQEMAGRTVFIPYANGKCCPVKALKAWLDLTGIRSGPIFRAVNKHDQVSERALTAQSVSLIVKAAVEAVGGDPTIVSGHSLRAGYVTTAAMVGLQPYQIREQTGHRSDATLAKYIRPVAKRKIPSLL